MNKFEFRKMLKSVGSKKMIGRYINNLINLNTKQINELIKLKNKEGMKNVSSKV